MKQTDRQNSMCELFSEVHCRNGDVITALTAADQSAASFTLLNPHHYTLRTFSSLLSFIYSSSLFSHFKISFSFLALFDISMCSFVFPRV